MRAVGVAAAIALLVAGCTRERQLEMQRDVEVWAGDNGVLEIYAGEQLVRRFVKVDKLSTAYGSTDADPRSYRHGYGVLDENLNMRADADEKRVYFEFAKQGTNYVFFENPR